MRPQPTVIMELRPGARGRCEPLAAFPAPQPHSRRHTGMVSQRIRTRVRVTGIVQGVGFRPFVYSLATGLGLGGLVGNDVDGVFAEVEGAPEAVEKFMVALSRDAPPLASVERIATSPLRPQGSTVFSIARSQPGGERRTLVSADTATCADCLAELADPADRRFGYPFLNCTNCGPRFTIVTGVPYDRALTTMAGFAMCGPCAAEYHDPANRRFHAQPTCCPGCGPRLRLVDHTGASLFVDPVVDPVVDPAVDPVEGAADLLARGGVLAVKGLGGYHLAADAASEAATAALRARKHREDKPFAIMVAGLDQARALCEVDDVAADLLTSRRRPVVLLPRRTRSAAGPRTDTDTESGAVVAHPVAPGNRCLGVMLPYTPLHHLLLAKTGPIVLTSGNVSDEPIAYADDDALARLRGIADAFLIHNRPIHVRTDDSVVRPFRGGAALVRRARGHAPEPLTVRAAFARPVLACGAELKSTFCLAKGDRAFVSQHIGDLENAETLRSFTKGIAHFRALFDITPEVIAHDLHPDYLSTKYALDLADPDADPDGPDLVGVQHHHAHIASCLADNGADGDSRGRDQAAVADGRRLHRRGLPGRAARPARRAVPQRGKLGQRAGDGAPRRQLTRHLERGTAVRRGGRAGRRPGPGQLRGPGGRRARAARRSGRTRRVSGRGRAGRRAPGIGLRPVPLRGRRPRRRSRTRGDRRQIS